MSKHPDRAQDYLEHILEALERIQRWGTRYNSLIF